MRLGEERATTRMSTVGPKACIATFSQSGRSPRNRSKPTTNATSQTGLIAFLLAGLLAIPPCAGAKPSTQNPPSTAKRLRPLRDPRILPRRQGGPRGAHDFREDRLLWPASECLSPPTRVARRSLARARTGSSSCPRCPLAGSQQRALLDRRERRGQQDLGLLLDG